MNFQERIYFNVYYQNLQVYAVYRNIWFYKLGLFYFCMSHGKKKRTERRMWTDTEAWMYNFLHTMLYCTFVLAYLQSIQSSNNVQFHAKNAQTLAVTLDQVYKQVSVKLDIYYFLHKLWLLWLPFHHLIYCSSDF